MAKASKSPKPKMITQSRIIDEYGWTKSLINNFLPEPTLKKNPHYSSAAPMKVGEEDTVKDVMKTPEFQAAMQKATKRKEAANTAVSTKITNMHDNIECFITSISISILPDDELRKRTLQEKQNWYNRHPHYNNYDDEYSDLDEPIYKDVHEADEDTLIRWIVNYIRHNLVDYDNFLYKISGKVGSIGVYPEIKTAVLEKIAVAYPQYKEECERQMTCWPMP